LLIQTDCNSIEESGKRREGPVEALDLISSFIYDMKFKKE
jgi:hypothetical protein